MSDTPSLDPKSYEALLHFYAEAGVVDLLDDMPIDRFEQTKDLAQKRREKLGLTKNASGQTVSRSGNINGGNTHSKHAPTMSGQPQQISQNAGFSSGFETAIPDQAAIDMAVQAAQNAKTLDDLKQAVLQFQGCNLRNGAKNTVFADGNPDTGIMFIGEAPGAQEDRQGLPFVGPAGQLLDRMLAAIQLDREHCYITNMIPWRPPGNRNPTQHEINVCLPFLRRHIELIEPKLIVTLGNISTKALLQTSKGILSMRGNWAEYMCGDRTVPTMPSLHPAYLLRNPIAKRHSWQDLLAVSSKLSEVGQ